MTEPDQRQLCVRGQVVADYLLSPDLDPTLSPRPYLHPVRTLAGVAVTDALPADRRWHLGAGLAMPDVSGTNLWGGRTYVRGAGYTWRDDHGRIVHRECVADADDHVTHRLDWRAADGTTLLVEERHLAARPLPGRPDAWVLDVAYTLTAPDDRDVTMRSPATNGRPGRAGYGGFFWRGARGPTAPRVFTATTGREGTVNGSAEPWVALVSPDPLPYTLVFTGPGDGCRWFVRAAMYPGVCAAFAFDQPRVLPAGRSFTGAHAVVVADAVLSPRDAGRVAAAAVTDPADAGAAGAASRRNRMAAAPAARQDQPRAVHAVRR